MWFLSSSQLIGSRMCFRSSFRLSLGRVDRPQQGGQYGAAQQAHHVPRSQDDRRSQFRTEEDARDCEAVAAVRDGHRRSRALLHRVSLCDLCKETKPTTFVSHARNPFWTDFDLEEVDTQLSDCSHKTDVFCQVLSLGVGIQRRQRRSTTCWIGWSAAEMTNTATTS